MSDLMVLDRPAPIRLPHEVRDSILGAALVDGPGWTKAASRFNRAAKAAGNADRDRNRRARRLARRNA